MTYVTRHQKSLRQREPEVVSNLKVCAHDLASLLVEALSVPVRVEGGQRSHQPVVFTQQQRVQGGQGDVLVGSIITCRSRTRLHFGLSWSFSA